MGILKNTLKIFIIATIAYWLLARFVVIGFIGDFLDLIVAMMVGGAVAGLYFIVAIIGRLMR